MNAHRSEVADVFREFQDDYLLQYGASPQQRKILRELPLLRPCVRTGESIGLDRICFQEGRQIGHWI